MYPIQSYFSHFKELLEKYPMNVFAKKGFNEVINKYNCISDITNIKKEEIEKIVNDSKLFIISQDEEYNQMMHCNYFIIGFENTIIILDISHKSFFQNILSTYCKLPICILGDYVKIINELEICKYYQDHQIRADDIFNDEIHNFKMNLGSKMRKKSNQINQFWKLISSCIIGYLIKKSYFQIDYDRFKSFIKDKNNFSPNDYINEDDYVELRVIGIGSRFQVVLIYLIEQRELRAIKKPNFLDSRTSELIDREKKIYMKIKHPFVPKFYGIVKDKNYLVLEFINGKELTNVNQMQLNEDEIITVIFELILLVFFFHSHNMIIRDLKKNNVIIDINKNLVMIDFDQVHEYQNITERSILISESIAPEIKEGGMHTYKSDIYSLGITILEILPKKNMTTNFNVIEEICNNCMNKNPDRRPLIIDILKIFYQKFNDRIKIDLASYGSLFDIEFKDPKKLDNNDNCIIQDEELLIIDKKIEFAYYSIAADQNIPKALFYLGKIFFTSHDINKAIYYLMIAAKKNDPDAQFSLGLLYYEGKYVGYNMNKAIRYFKLSADQNNSEAQFNLGQIYDIGTGVKCDTEKAFHYYELAAKQNHSKAQFFLGLIYLRQREIDKAIHYMTLSAHQNISRAQFYLGYLYSKSPLVKLDIKKAIHYYKLAAKQNDPDAQFDLGVIYNEGQQGSRDSKKAFYYFEQAAKNNIPEAIYNLGAKYYWGDGVPRDIKEAINLFKRASNLNLLPAHMCLGDIYSKGIDIQQDINKAILYYTLAANKNDSNAQLNLGILYYERKNEKGNIEKAFRYFEQAAENKNRRAQYYLGRLYYTENDVPHDIYKAIYYFQLAAEQKKKGTVLSWFNIL